MISGWVQDLLSLTDNEWGKYTFSGDPLIGKIPPQLQDELRRKTLDSAALLVNNLRREYGTASPQEIAERLGVKVLKKSGELSSGYTLFASYEEPDTITVYTDVANAADQLLAEENLQELVGNVSAQDVLIAHELYHYLEQTVPDVFSAQKHLTLWKLGPVENRSRVLCLEEIGAMAFAREMSCLQCSPYIFEVIMLYTVNMDKAAKLYANMMGFHHVDKETGC